MAQSGTTDLGANIGSGGGGGGGVTSLNGLTGALTLVPGTGIVITPGAGTITIASTLAGGTVTNFSFVNANGFAGTVTNPTTTPALTLTTTVTGVLKGNGTAISAAVAGTDYVIPSGSITGTAGNITATSNSTLTTLSALSLPGSQVTGNISGTASNITATSNSTLTTLSALSLPTSQLSGSISLTTQVSGILPVANGGTAHNTAAGARTPTGLNIDQETAVNATNYTVLNTDRQVAQTGTMSAPITFTLPAANTVNAGQILNIVDNSGTVTTTNTISIAPHAGDTINNSASSSLIRSAFGRALLVSDGISNWTDPVTGISRGGTGLQTLPASGQLLIGNAANSYTLGTLSAGPGISITNGSGTIQVNNTSISSGQLFEGFRRRNRRRGYY